MGDASGHSLLHRRGRLAPVEVAEAAVLADLAVGLHLLGFLLPFGGALQAMAVTPFAALAARHRTRAVLVAAGCGAMVAFLVAGLHLSLWVMASGLIGLAVGRAYRRHWGWVRSTAVAAALAGSLMAGATVVTLLVLPHLRRLTLAQLRITWRGATRVLHQVGLAALAGPLTTVVDDALRWWWATLPGFEFVFVAVVALVTRGFSHPAIRRLELAVGRPQSPLPADEGEAGPVPATLEHVSHRYPDATTDALCDVSLSIEEGRLTTIVGPNGSGKSTLARLLAGMPPTAGRVLRPGQAALGRPGGTALIFQRPESQVLGVRVGDDIRWGAGPARGVELAALLRAVGLGGMEERETATLSGGQLQRLAIAAALSRQPALLVSDESTSMLDPPGQEEVLSVLRRLVASGRTTVVHVTHQLAELDGAAVIALERGRAVPLAAMPIAAMPIAAWPSASGPGPEASGATAGLLPPHPGPAPAPGPPSEPLVRLCEVGYVYAPGTPWARRALSGVSLEIGRGEVVAVVGPNAAGKSTLAWVLGGLTAPTEGEATMDGVPLSACLGQVGITFQHARLQLFRSRVERDVIWGTELDREGAAAALAEVGLPEELLDRRIDALSGGEQRRVALAGMLARRPSLLVLDEPLAGLDGEGRKALADIVARLRASRTVSVVIVSHDVAFAGQLADRTVAMDGGRLVDDGRHQGVGPGPGPGEPAPHPADAPHGGRGPGARRPDRGVARSSGRRPVRRSSELPLLRYVPGTSPVHRLWAGTKLLAVLAFSIAASVSPSWASEAVLAGILVLWMAVARIGRGALPRVPGWFAGGLALGAVLALLAGGGTRVRVGGLDLGLSGLNLWAEFTCLVLLLIVASLLVGLTTPLAELGPALSRLLAPVRLVRLPVDELVVTVALCARSLTLLGEELRILGAARRARRPLQRPRPRGLVDVLFDAGDLVVTGLVSAVRRAGEMAQAIEARGGLLQRVPGGPGPGPRDAVALVLVLAAAVGMALV